MAREEQQQARSSMLQLRPERPAAGRDLDPRFRRPNSPGPTSPAHGEITQPQDLCPWLAADGWHEMGFFAPAKGLNAMTSTSTDNIEDHRARCQPQLLKLRLIARDENGGTALTWQAVTEVVQATGAILAEAEAAGSAARAAVGQGAATLLSMRAEPADGRGQRRDRRGRGRRLQPVAPLPAQVRGADLGDLDGPAGGVRPGLPADPVVLGPAGEGCSAVRPG